MHIEPSILCTINISKGHGKDLEPTNPLDSFLFNEEKANIYIDSLVLEFKNHLTVEKRVNIMREIDVNQGTSKIFINSLTRKLSY